MSDPAHGASVPDALSVVAVAREFADLVLAPAEPDEDHGDVSELLAASLRRLLPDAQLTRAQLEVTESGGRRPKTERDRRQLESLPGRAIRDALSARDVVTVPGARGEATLVGALAWRADTVELIALQRAGGASRTDAELFETILKLAAAVIAVRHAQAEARLDALTGCLNHGAMHAQLEKEIARAERNSSDLACVMLDLDGFKAVNDRYGHPVGDRILKSVSAALRDECRRYDSCCRYGGDEFLIILPDTDLSEAERAAERLRSAVAQGKVVHEGEEIAVTATTGVAGWAAGEASGDLIARADHDLMRSKATEDDERRR